MKSIPLRTKTAPKAKTRAGISWKTAIPKIVAPIGSSNAIVAVSNDLKLDREEKYSVWAIAVGSSPKPISGRIVAGRNGNRETVFPVGILRIATTAAVNA